MSSWKSAPRFHHHHRRPNPQAAIHHPQRPSYRTRLLPRGTRDLLLHHKLRHSSSLPGRATCRKRKCQTEINDVATAQSAPSATTCKHMAHHHNPQPPTRTYRRLTMHIDQEVLEYISQGRDNAPVEQVKTAALIVIAHELHELNTNLKQHNEHA